MESRQTRGGEQKKAIVLSHLELGMFVVAV